MEPTTSKIALSECQRQRSLRYRKEQASAGRTPVVVFLDAATRSRLKALAPSLVCSKQLPAVVEAIVASYFNPRIPPANPQTIVAPPSTAKSDNEPSLTIKKAPAKIKGEPQPKVNVTLQVESFSDLILRVRRLARAAELETKRLRYFKVKAAGSGIVPPRKEPREATNLGLYEEVANEVVLKAKTGEPLEAVEKAYKTTLQTYAQMLANNLDITQAELMSLGGKTRPISDQWPIQSISAS